MNLRDFIEDIVWSRVRHQPQVAEKLQQQRQRDGVDGGEGSTMTTGLMALYLTALQVWFHIWNQFL